MKFLRRRFLLKNDFSLKKLIKKMVLSDLYLSKSELKTNDESVKVYGYPAGTWGPEPADELIENTNWRYPCKNLADDGKYCEL